MRQLGGTGIIGQDMVCGFGGIKVELRKDIDLNLGNGKGSVKFVPLPDSRTTFIFKCKIGRKYKITKKTFNVEVETERFKVACVNSYPQLNGNFRILRYDEFEQVEKEVIFPIPEGGKYVIVMLGNPCTDRIGIKVKEVS